MGRVLKYTGGIAVTLLVIAGRLALNPWLGHSSNRHLVFLPTVMVVAWFAGLVPGLLSAVLCTAALVVFYAHPLRASSDVLIFLVIASAIVALVESLRRAQARADAAAKARERVLAIVAHDLRSPLTTIRFASATLARDSIDSGVRLRQVGSIERAVGRMDNLIRDLVEATTIERLGVELALRWEDVDSMIHEIADGCAMAAQEQGLTIETPPSPPGLTILCDRQRILQVLGNLVGNALRFTPKGGRITIRTEIREAAVRFEVKDTGPGIPAKDLPHIFEPFWHSDRNGSGLGLYIAESLVRAHDGQIGVDTRPGLGATFHFTLPRRAEPRPDEGLSGYGLPEAARSMSPPPAEVAGSTLGAEPSARPL
jgi:signal transduction histidine kinase